MRPTKEPCGCTHDGQRQRKNTRRCSLKGHRFTSGAVDAELIAAMLAVLRDVAENTVSLELRSRVYAVIAKATR